jgi:hypothetical protein
MPGRGPTPKPAARKARRNTDARPQTLLRFEQARQPRLPTVMPTGSPWPPETRAWWRMWARSPQAEHFSSTDWAFLLDTAVLHGRFWAGDMASTAGELRLRVSKFGATPEDRMRLRMSFAAADEADARRATPADAARQRYGDLRVLRPPAAPVEVWPSTEEHPGGGPIGSS